MSFSNYFLKLQTFKTAPYGFKEEQKPVAGRAPV